MVSFTFVYRCDPKLLWSIGRTSCLYYSTRVDPVNSNDFIKNMSIPLSAVCCHDLLWNVIDWILLGKTMGVSKLRLDGWLLYDWGCSHGHEIGSSWFCEKLSPLNEIKAPATTKQISWEIVYREWGPRNCHDFLKNIVLLVAISEKLTTEVKRKKMGSNMSSCCIEFCDILSCNISRVHCKHIHISHGNVVGN